MDCYYCHPLCESISPYKPIHSVWLTVLFFGWYLAINLGLADAISRIPIDFVYFGIAGESIVLIFAVVVYSLTLLLILVLLSTLVVIPGGKLPLAFQQKADALSSASFYCNDGEPLRLLVIRGVDDEASMALAFGSIGVRISNLVSRTVEVVLVTIALFFILASALAVILGLFSYPEPWLSVWSYAVGNPVAYLFWFISCRLW